MDTQTEAQIYLSDQRGCSQVDSCQSFHSFNFGRYFDESRRPFGALQLVNDSLLKPEHSLNMRVEENTDVLVIPVVGGLEYNSSVGDGFVEAGQCQRFSLAAGMTYEIINPYKEEFINFLEIWIRNDNPLFVTALNQMAFNISDKNNLLPLFTTHLSKGFIGKYDGRQDGIYQQQSPDNGVFVFVLSGAFEVQNRLLHERDGLSLTTIKDGTVDFEALSNEAILLVLEVPQHT